MENWSLTPQVGEENLVKIGANVFKRWACGYHDDRCFALEARQAIGHESNSLPRRWA